MSEPEGSTDKQQPESDAPEKHADILHDEARNNLEEQATRNQAGSGRNNRAPPDAPSPPRKPEYWYNRVSITDWITAISTLVIMVWAGLQWYEMHTGGTDTKTIAEAAKTNACAATQIAAASDRNATAAENMSTAADQIRKAAENMVVQEQRVADASKSAIEASNRQSKAALDASIAAFRNDERAWVGVGAYTTPKFTASDPFAFAIPFVNSGKSPAIRTEKLIYFAITTSWPTGPTPKPNDKFEPAAAIAPQGTYVVNITNRAPNFNDIMAKKSFLSFSGTFRYYDVYGSVAHETSFCLVFNPDTKEMSFCLTGNEMN